MLYRHSGGIYSPAELISSSGHSSVADDHTMILLESVLQLSPPVHRHTKGRQMVSLLRRAEVQLALLELAAAVVRSASSTGEGKKAALQVLCSVCCALCSLAGADLSIAQGFTSAEQQELWVRTMSKALAILQASMDAPPPPIPAAVSGVGEGDLSTRAQVEDALRCVLEALGRSCLRNPGMQKVCGTVLPTIGASRSLLSHDNVPTASASAAVSPPPSSAVSKAAPNPSLVAQMCSLSSKYYKDKR